MLVACRPALTLEQQQLQPVYQSRSRSEIVHNHATRPPTLISFSSEYEAENILPPSCVARRNGFPRATAASNFIRLSPRFSEASCRLLFRRSSGRCRQL